MQQVGGAIGLSCLVTLASRHAASLMRSDHVSAAVAATRGYVLSWRIGAVLLAIGGVTVFALLEHVVATPRNPEAEAVEVPAQITPPLPATST